MMIMPTLETSGETDAIVIIKAAPQIGQKHGETVCCAGVDLEGNWLRLYPVSFRTLQKNQKFKRWDRINFKWRLPKAEDQRIESRRIDQQSLEIVGKLKNSEKEAFLAPLIVTSLDKEREKNKSLALLKAQDLQFFYEQKTEEEIQKQKVKFDELAKQTDMFIQKETNPIEPCPYKFKYKYKTDDGPREGTCQDWEIEATYYHHKRRDGEEKALQFIMKTFGEDYPKKGMLLAMGTHSLHPNTWLINGVIRMDEVQQLALF